MDDLTVIKMQMMVDYPDLTADDVSMLISNKYKTNDLFFVKMPLERIRYYASKGYVILPMHCF